MSDLPVKIYTAENTAHLRGKTGKLTREKTANFPVKMRKCAGENASIKVMLFKKNMLLVLFFIKNKQTWLFQFNTLFYGFYFWVLLLH